MVSTPLTLPRSRPAPAAGPDAAGPETALRAQLAAAAAGLADTDPGRLAALALRGRAGGDGLPELLDLAVDAAASLTVEEPAYSRLAARLLAGRIADEAAREGVETFTQSIAAGHRAGLISDHLARVAELHGPALDALVDPSADDRFEYFGLRTVHTRYLLRHPVTRRVLERPQHFLLRVACGLADGDTAEAVAEVGALYRLMSRLDYLPSSPTLFNSGTRHPQMSSCFLLDSPQDELDSIYQRYAQVARLSKHSGGIGIPFTRVRSRGSLIRGTNGKSNGIVPFLRTLDASVAAVNQGGRRKGAAAVYLEPWHADVEEFLELRDNTGEDARRTHNLNLAHWVPDEFMRRVEDDGDWSLFDPATVPHLTDLYGEEFDAAYRTAEADGLAAKSLPARALYARMMRTLAQTGNGWMTFKDAANRTSNQTGLPGRVVHSSNLCTEIMEVSDDGETAVCNLGSVNLAAHLTADRRGMDWEKLDATVRTAVRFLDRVIDRNLYPTPEAATANARRRPVGLGVMGLQDVFFRMGLAFDSARAREVSDAIAERVLLTAYATSAGLAREYGAHPTHHETRAAAGVLHPDHYPDAAPRWPERWAEVRASIAEHGMRNSLLVAIAPTATIASIAGVSECIEPQVSNLFKRETLSGEFLQVNPYLVAELKRQGRWTAETREALRDAEGSVAGLGLDADTAALYRTAWELPQRALIDLAAGRTPYLDQSQSLNLFQASPTIGKLSAMYAYAWRKGLKSPYYLRSRPATRIARTATAGASDARPEPAAAAAAATAPDPEAVACSLENPEICEACQ